MRSTAAATAVLAACLLAAGCGSDDDADGEGARLTKAAFITRADAICTDANDRIDAIPEPQTTEELAELGRQVLAIGREQLARLRALRPPAADEETINGAYDVIEEQLGVAEELVAAAEEGDLQGLQELLEQGERLDARGDRIARDYGLKECGSG
jgi:hypothetical protein